MTNSNTFKHARPPYEVDNFPDLDESTYPLAHGKDCEFDTEFGKGFNLVEKEEEDTCVSFGDVFNSIKFQGTCIEEQETVGDKTVSRFLQVGNVPVNNILGYLDIELLDSADLSGSYNVISTGSNSKEYGEVFSHSPQGTSFNITLNLTPPDGKDLCDSVSLEWYEDVGGDSFEEFPFAAHINGVPVSQSDLRRATCFLSQNSSTKVISLQMGVTVKTQYYWADGDTVEFYINRK